MLLGYIVNNYIHVVYVRRFIQPSTFMNHLIFKSLLNLMLEQTDNDATYFRLKNKYLTAFDAFYLSSNINFFNYTATNVICFSYL